MDLQKLCLEVVDLSTEVGKFISANLNKIEKNSIGVKGLNDFVTFVDTTSEKMLVEKLSQLLPESGFLTEESTIDKKGKIYNWIIDPLDGTTNFIHGLPPFCISIALQENQKTILGVIYEVNDKECFYAWAGGEKAFLNEKEITVSQTNSVRNSLIATGFPYHDFQKLSDFMKTLEYFMKHSHGLRRLGSAAADLAYVACGRFEGFYEYGLNAWDVAAGTFIVQQAGGKVSDFNGQDNYLFGKELVSSNSLIFNEFLDIIKNLMR